MRSINPLTSCRHLTNAPAHSYQTDPSQIKQRLQQAAKDRAASQQLGNNATSRQPGYSAASQQAGDSASISAAGRRALKEKQSSLARTEQTPDRQTLPSLHAGALGVQNDFETILSAFEKTEGTKTDTFDTYVNQMASTYQLMKERIEQKYAAEDRQKEYYTAEDGTMQELTKEKELELLERAYTNHSTFMAASTEIWQQLQNFQVQITPQHAQGNTSPSEPAPPASSAGRHEKGVIRAQAFEAFMSAIGNDNLELLSRTPQERNSLKLNLNISQQARQALNQIWDYYAERK